MPTVNPTIREPQNNQNNQPQDPQNNTGVATSLATSQQTLQEQLGASGSAWSNPNVKQAESQYNQFTNNMQNPLEVYNQAMQELGIGDVRTRVQDLRRQVVNTENAIRGVDENVTARTSNALVSEAQRNRLVQAEQQPLQQQLQMQSGNYNVESQNLQELRGEAQTQTGFAMEGQNQGLEALKQRLGTAQEKERFAEEKRAAKAAEKFQKKVHEWEKRRAKLDRQWEKTKAQWEREDARWAAQQSAANSQPSASEIKRGAVSEIASAWKPGSDGYVSPNQWNRLLKEWTQAGYNTSDFVSQFKHLANPVHKRRSDLVKYQGV